MRATIGHRARLGVLLIITKVLLVHGIGITTYRDNETIPVLTGRIFSDKVPERFAYMDQPFACPLPRYATTSRSKVTWSLPGVLHGDRSRDSGFQFVMGHDVEVAHLCTKELGLESIERVKQLIERRYRAEFVLDNLPSATTFQRTDKQGKYYTPGSFIGKTLPVKHPLDMPQVLIHNHFTFVVRWRYVKDEKYRRDALSERTRRDKVIVGFEVFPRSLTAAKRVAGLPSDLSKATSPMLLELKGKSIAGVHDGQQKLTVPFTYAVYWREDTEVVWENRTLRYTSSIEAPDLTSQWLALRLSLAFAGLLAVISIILRAGDRGAGSDDVGPDGPQTPDSSPLRARKPIKTGKYGALDSARFMRGKDMLTGKREDDSTVSSSGPKLSKDISTWLPALIGTGVQLLAFLSNCFTVTAIILLQPTYHSAYIGICTTTTTCAALWSGYVSAQLQRTLGETARHQNASRTALLGPTLVTAFFLLLNTFTAWQASALVMSNSMLMALCGSWAALSLLSAYLSSWTVSAQQQHRPRISSYGSPMGTPTQPQRRAVSTQLTISKPLPTSRYTPLTCAVAGFPPFVVYLQAMAVWAVQTELDPRRALQNLLFLAIMIVLLMVTHMESTKLALYMIRPVERNLAKHTLPFFISMMTAFYLFVYFLYAYMMYLHITGFVATVLALLLAGLGCIIYAVVAGAIGWFSI